MCINFNFCVRIFSFFLSFVRLTVVLVGFFFRRRRRAFFFRQRDYGNNLWTNGCVEKGEKLNYTREERAYLTTFSNYIYRTADNALISATAYKAIFKHSSNS